MKKIAFFDSKPYDIESFEQENKNYNFQIKFFESKLNHDTVNLASDYNAICAFVNDLLDKTVLEKLKKYGIEIISLRCAGYNNVDLNTAFNNIHVTRVPAYSPYAVAEHALAMIMTLNRKTHKAYSRTKENNFNINGLLGFDLHKKTAGIIGTGKIGLILCKILKGIGMEVIAFDAFPNQTEAKKIGFSYVSIEELYQKSDIISLHCPLNKETYHLINKKSLSMMKSNVMIINTGRGALIDSKALINALKTEKIGYAGLDVYEEESEYFFEDFSSHIITDDVLARLLSFPNVLITSHQAFFTKEALHNIAQTTLTNISDYFKNKPLINEICYHCNKDCLHKKTGKCW